MSKILLVEDNEINRDMLSRRLVRKGYEVLLAVDGAEAVAKTESEQPDLVLMDLHLPVLNGWEATKQIKANPQTKAIPVIALTADALAGEREKAITAGCDDYDTKPVNFPQLIAKMTKLITPVALPPAVSQPPTNTAQPDRDRQQRTLRTQLRRQDFDPPIYSIIGYSDFLLRLLQQSSTEKESLRSDIQKLLTSGKKLLKLTHAVLNPALVDIQQQDVDLLAPTLRRELLTPLSTIVGYSEILLEDAPTEFIPDLERIYTSAQDLLVKVNDLDSTIKQRLASIRGLKGDPQAVENDPVAVEQTVSTDYLLAASLPIKNSQIENSQILVIDHDAYSGALISRYLESQGAQVAVASSVQQTLETIAHSPFNLILLETNLPEASSLEVLRQVKGNQDWQHIPVMMIAAFDEYEAVAGAIALGAADYVTKPYQSIMLQAKVANCLEHRQLQNQQIALTQQVAILQQELAQSKQAQQATEIKQTDYFQQIPAVVAPTVVEEPGEALPPSSEPASSPPKILLVEDNELNSDMLSRRLKRVGYEVALATDGAEGVAKAFSERPSVILMDISLPVMDGWEATQQLKADAKTCKIPIIALTAHAMSGDREKALSAGCDDYDTKPIDLPRLLGKIEACLKCSTVG